MLEPPGRMIYADKERNLYVYEVDGAKERMYGQNVCLFGKLFIEHKTLYFDPDPFHFYILVEKHPERISKVSVSGGGGGGETKRGIQQPIVSRPFVSGLTALPLVASTTSPMHSGIGSNVAAQNNISSNGSIAAAGVNPGPGPTASATHVVGSKPITPASSATSHKPSVPARTYTSTLTTTTTTPRMRCRPVGYFSKEKNSQDGYNLACILVLPQHQRKGYGKFIISLSYELSKLQLKLGSPEKPLSDLGKLSYRSYWTFQILRMLHESKCNTTVESISKRTSIRVDDVISTLDTLKLLRFLKGQYVMVASESRVKQLLQAFVDRQFSKSFCRAELLTWTPEEDEETKHVQDKAK
jgi:hypothetical protein